VNPLTGEGLDEPFAGAKVVVDVTNSPSFEKEVLTFIEASGRNIAEAEVKAGVKHHVTLSVVGADRLPQSACLRAKLAQEKVIRDSLMPYTILRSTQVFEYLGGIAKAATDGQTVHLPPALVQPVAADEVVATLADIAVSPPVNGTIEVGGPERVSFADVVERYLLKMGDPRQVIADVDARYYGARLNNHSLIPGADARTGSESFEEWFALVQSRGITWRAYDLSSLPCAN
jgi:uncharacterized protein YbjT (DUF2867 family)